MPNQDQERCLAEHFFKTAGFQVANLIMADKPDVLFDHSGKRIGMEVTDATPEEHVRAYRALKRMDWNGFTFPSNLQHREERRPTQELIEETIDIHSEWVDTSDTTGRWAARIKERIIDKHRAFNHPDFQRFDENWLLISDLQNSPITHEPQLVTLKEFFLSAIAQFRPDSFFDRTFIHTSDAGLIEWDHRAARITWTISPTHAFTLP